MKIILSIILSIFSITEMSSQNMGVNTETPKATLHVEPTNKTNPNGADGILIPRLADFPGNGVEKGHLIYLKDHPTELEGFYFWDGTTWVWLINNYDRTIDKTTYVASGSGYVNVRNVSSDPDANKRDGIEAKLYVNGGDASLVNGNLNIEGANSFPTGNNTIVVFLSGSLVLDVNDRLLFKVNRYYRDSNTPISIGLDPLAPSNLTLKYLGPQ